MILCDFHRGDDQLNKIAIWFIVTSCLAVIITAFAVNFVLHRQPEITSAEYSGTSENWNIDVNIFEEGKTTIDVKACKEINFPKILYIDVQDPSGNTYTVVLTYNEENNCYHYENPTISAISNNVVDLFFTVRSGDSEEIVELHRDNVTYYFSKREKDKLCNDK